MVFWCYPENVARPGGDEGGGAEGFMSRQDNRCDPLVEVSKLKVEIRLQRLHTKPKIGLCSISMTTVDSHIRKVLGSILSDPCSVLTSLDKVFYLYLSLSLSLSLQRVLNGCLTMMGVIIIVGASGHAGRDGSIPWVQKTIIIVIFLSCFIVDT